MEKERRSGVYRFVAIVFLGIILAGATGAVISYLKWHELFVSFANGTVWALTAFVFLTSVLLYKMLPRMLRCSECGRPASDVLVFGGQQRRRYCREHMLDAFRKEFVGFPEKMVVFYPSLEFKTGPFVYQYHILEDIPEEHRNGKTGRMLTEALDSISGNCSRCGRPANVAYFGPGSFKWNPVRVAGIKREFPAFDDVVVRPENLCRECIVDHVAYSLLNFNSQFGEGVVLPYKGKGAMLPGVG